MFNKNKKDQKGATAVEMAIILPLLIILIFGIIEFSLLLYNKNIINHAAREGARAGVVYTTPNRVPIGNPSDPGFDESIKGTVLKYIENRLISFSSAVSDHTIISVPSDICPKNTGSNKELKVKVTYSYSFLILPAFLESFFSGGLQQGIPVGTEAVMICE